MALIGTLQGHSIWVRVYIHYGCVINGLKNTKDIWEADSDPISLLPKVFFGIYTEPWTVPIRLNGTGCPRHRSELFFFFLGVLQQPAKLWADSMVYCCRKSEDGMSRSWIPSWWAKASPGNHTSTPYPSHALHWQLIPKYVAITHPQHYCGVFFLLDKLLLGWWGKKTDWGMTCMWDYHIVLSAHLLRPKAGYLEPGLVI